MTIPFRKCVSIVKSHLARGEREREQWDKWHSWYLGDFWAEGDEDEGQGGGVTLETNVPYAFIDTMIANICPTNPMMSIESKGDDLKEAAKARELLVNDTLKRDKMAAKAWDLATFCGICGRAFSKTVWNSRKQRPQTYIIDPRYVFYDMSRDFEDTRYICEAIALTKEEFDERITGKKYDAAVAKETQASAFPEWMKDRSQAEWFVNEDSRAQFEWVIIYEFYDLLGGRLYHFTEDAEKPLFAGELPYLYMRNPYAMIIFNKNLRENCGLSDIKLIQKPLDRMNELDTLELIFAKSTIPTTLVNKNAFDKPEEAKDLIKEGTQPGAVLELPLVPGARLEDAVTWTRAPTTSPSFKDSRDRAGGIVDKTLGLPNYLRGEYGGAQVATELSLVDTATRTRNGRRIHVLEDWITEVSKRILALWKQYLTVDKPVVLRDRRAGTSTELDRAELAFPKIADGKLQPEAFDDELFYDFESAAYSPTENHKLIQLQKMQQFIQILAKLPGVNMQALTHRLLELLGLEDVKADPQQAPPGGAPQPGAAPGQPGIPGSPGMSGMPGDVVAQPGPSEQTTAMLPPGVNPNASQPTA